ncbi:hypothetical protein PNK_1041 [Candidatus Protochlamydia naegleriophila]|uniref:Uncharacterized protein n=1 Tax=Candidatus Protochlamydia naegleriophila TaxID=389348 RepID=A0A0U5JDG4_9BACT|nr:hypothetical protein [Candidatus Protochlamydia naegleriophila]CUI16658.1 hypothetical protein PNK_1041 [Candidatus Protochlamydia naegleriophila]
MPHRSDSRSRTKPTQHEYKHIQKAIESLEQCLSSEFLTELERHNLEEAVRKLKSLESN